MFCKNCGKEIDNNAYVCPHCGVKVVENEAATSFIEKKANGFGIASFILGIASIYFAAYFCITAIVGLILGIIAIRKKKDCTSCNGLGIAGVVLSSIFLFIWALVWIILGAALFSLIGMGV